MLELTYNPGAKTKGFFGGNKGQGDEKLPDYVEGYLHQYNPETIKEIAFKKTESGKLKPIFPKSLGNVEPEKTHYKIHGRWNKYLKADDESLFDVNETRYFEI